MPFSVEDDSLEAWHISTENYTVAQHVIGQGKFGNVRLGEWRGTQVAIKCLFNKNDDINKAMARKEIHIMQELHHPCIVQFLGYSNDHAKGDLVILMEFLVNGSLEDYVLKHHKKITLEMRAQWCRDMSQAMAYLHNKTPTFLIHRDVKPSNFMLTSVLRCKMGDFGISRMFNRVPELAELPPEEQALPKDDTTEEGDETDDGSLGDNQAAEQKPPRSSSGKVHPEGNLGAEERSPRAGAKVHPDDKGNIGSLRYMAPEVRQAAEEKLADGEGTANELLFNPLVGSDKIEELLFKARYSVQCDVFSLGMVFYFIYEGHPPFIQGTEDPVQHFEHLKNGKRPECKQAPPAASRIIELCLRYQPLERPTSLELISLIKAIPTQYASKSSFARGSKPTYLPVPALKLEKFEEVEAQIVLRQDPNYYKSFQVTSPSKPDVAESPILKNQINAATNPVRGLESTSPARANVANDDPSLVKWTINETGFTVDDGMLGQGKFGVVRLGEWNGTKIAVKCLFNNLNTAKIYKEIGLMQQLHHPCVVQFLGFAKNHTQGDLVIVMEYLEEGSLESYIEKNFKTITMAQKVKWCRDMASALSYLHNRQPTFLIHRDVKPSNFMLSSAFTCKLGDFGISRFFDRDPDAEPVRTASHRTKGSGGGGGGTIQEGEELTGPAPTVTTLLGQINSVPAGVVDQTSNVGTLRYMAPEVRGVASDVKKVATTIALDSSTAGDDDVPRNEDGTEKSVARYSVQVDIFSIGMVIYYVFEGVSPSINGASDPFTHFANLAKGKRPICQLSPPTARRVIELCLRWEPTERPTSLELIHLVEAIPTEKVVSKVMGITMGTKENTFVPVSPRKLKLFRDIEAQIEERKKNNKH